MLRKTRSCLFTIFDAMTCARAYGFFTTYLPGFFSILLCQASCGMKPTSVPGIVRSGADLQAASDKPSCTWKYCFLTAVAADCSPCASIQANMAFQMTWKSRSGGAQSENLAEFGATATSTDSMRLCRSPCHCRMWLACLKVVAKASVHTYHGSRQLLIRPLSFCAMPSASGTRRTESEDRDTASFRLIPDIDTNRDESVFAKQHACTAIGGYTFSCQGDRGPQINGPEGRSFETQ